VVAQGCWLTSLQPGHVEPGTRAQTLAGNPQNRSGLLDDLRSAELNFIKSEDQHPILEVDHHDAESAHFQKPAPRIDRDPGIARPPIRIMVKIGEGRSEFQPERRRLFFRFGRISLVMIDTQVSRSASSCRIRELPLELRQ
jgi:hypothetical protein